MLYLQYPSEYESWKGMKQRCKNRNSKSYHNYGGRGISVCREWEESFENFFLDMGPKPSTNHSLDRINNDGNYEPKNCRWATLQEQNRNSRHNLIINYRGRQKCATEWAEILGLSLQTIIGRYKRTGNLDPTIKEIPSGLRQWRKINRVTQKQLSEFLGVSLPLISHWERGRCFPSPEKLHLLEEIIASWKS